MESDTEPLEAMLDALKRQITVPTFRDAAKAFEAELREAKGLTREQKDDLWQRYQILWDERKSFIADRQERSEAAKQRYHHELLSLDFSYDGLPILQTFANWERVGEKVRAARERVKSIRAAVKADRSLLPPERKVVNEELDAVWFKISQSEDVAFDVHRKQADRLYNDAERAVDEMRPRDATPVFKAAQAEVNSLWLRSRDRETFRSLFDDLWQKLKLKKEDARRRYEESLARQVRGLDTLRGARAKALDALDRVKENKRANESRLVEARSRSESERVSGGIREDEETESAIERSIAELEEKIRNAEERLRD